MNSQTKFEISLIKMSRYIVLSSVLVVGSFGSAQILTPNEEFEKQLRPPLALQGQLFSVRLVPGENETKVFIAGVPGEEVLRVSELGFSAYTRAGTELRPLETSSQGSYFLIGEPLTGSSALQLDVDYGNRSERFDIKPEQDN